MCGGTNPTLGKTHFSALERYKNGEGNGDPNCPQSYSTKDTSPPLKLGKLARKTASSKER